MIRPLLPAFAAIYDLHWEDLEDMPWGEIREHVEQLDRWTSVLSAGMYQPKDE